MTTVDESELEKFKALSKTWWDKEGPLKTLHDINPERMAFIDSHTTLKDMRVLDVGCGGGILSESLAKKGASVTAIDLESTAIDAAIAHATKERLNIDYQHIALDKLKDNQFDIVTCYEMLEHVPSPKILVSQLSDKLKPQGHLFLSTINRTLKAYLYAIVGAEYLLRLLPRQTHDYQKFIKPAELSSYARAASLSVKHIEGLSYQPLSRKATLTEDVNVNYLMHCIKD